MKRPGKLIVMGLCLAALLCLAACSAEPPEATVEPTIPVAEALYAYNAACIRLDTAKNLRIRADITRQRQLGSDHYTEAESYNAAYSSPGASSMDAMVELTLGYGEFTTSCLEFYTGGTAYTRIGDSAFSSDMSASVFRGRQLPAVLLDPTLYGTVTAQQENGQTLIRFSDAAAPENWALAEFWPTLISAEGTATLDETGALTAYSYRLHCSGSAGSYVLEVSTTVSLPESLNLSGSFPEDEGTYTQLSCFDAPRLLLRAAGDICTAQAMSCRYTEQLFSHAAGITRNQQAQTDIWGLDETFMATTMHTTRLSGASGTDSYHTRSEYYRDGIYSCSLDGGEAIDQPGVTALQMRTACQDSVLASLLAIDCLAGAELTDTGDFLCLRFAATEDFTQTLCDYLYSSLNTDLDSTAESYTGDAVSGYLTVNKSTGLPTAAGMLLSRTHTIGGIRYPLTYQLDQAMTLSSTTAYGAITGEHETETPPETPASPLFYRVTGPNGQKMWLLGTIHLGDAHTGALPKEIYDAFRSADALAVEYDPIAFAEQLKTDAHLQNQLLAVRYYADGTALPDHLDPLLYQQAYPLLLASGSNHADAYRLKPAMLSAAIEQFYLQQEYGLELSKGVDLRLLTLAREQGKQIRCLESGLSQQQMLGSFSDPLQEYLLKKVLACSSKEYSAETRRLYTLWCQGDEAALTEAVFSDMADLAALDPGLYQEYMDAMYIRRNTQMFSAAEGYLQSGETVFFAVGLAHLLGEDGLINSLRAAGCRVELVSYQ